MRIILVGFEKGKESRTKKPPPEIEFWNSEEIPEQISPEVVGAVSRVFVHRGLGGVAISKVRRLFGLRVSEVSDQVHLQRLLRQEKGVTSPMVFAIKYWTALPRGFQITDSAVDRSLKRSIPFGTNSRDIPKKYR